MKEFIPVNEPLILQREKDLIQQCLDSGWISSEGPFVSQFENLFSQSVNKNYGIACSSGTAALEIAVKSLNIGPGDEVIVPTFTIISCVSAIIKTGATPVLVDADPLTWNMNVDHVRSLITKNTVAIMVVHIYGLPVDMDPIIEIAKKNSLAIIEDAAENIGGKYKQRVCGSFGDVSIFSFYPNKHVTTGEGGMIVTNSDEIASRSRSLRNLCFLPDQRFVHEEIGWNYRMTNLQAALGIGQLERLEETIKMKINIGETYNENLSDLKEINLPLKKTYYAENIYWVYGIVLKKETGLVSNEVMKKLRELAVGTRPFFYPMHKQPVFKRMELFKNGVYPVSEEIYKYGFYLPSGLTLKNEQIKKVCYLLKEILNH